LDAEDEETEEKGEWFGEERDCKATEDTCEGLSLVLVVRIGCVEDSSIMNE